MSRRARDVERLSVFMNGIRVGLLIREKAGFLSFAYDSTWLTQGKPLAISRQLPLLEKPFIGKVVRDYFDNLLPDDKRIREHIAARTRAAGAQAFDLLTAVGRDCVGALQFYPEGQEPGPVGPAQGKPLSTAEIAALLRNLRINPLGMDAESEFRISLAGAQSKTALLRQDGKWRLPTGATPTTHILKPPIGPVSEGPDLSLSVENEWLCLRILRAYGLETAEAEMEDFSGSRALVIERFDRIWAGKKLHRLPQEDLCQALGFGSEAKYESDGGPGIGVILGLLNESDRRDEDRRNFMKTQLIFWMLAAIDGHAKNFSLFIRPGGGFTLTPIYDVISALPHVNPKSFPRQKLKLAMAIGDKRHFKVDEIQSRHWLQTAKKHKFAGMEGVIAEVARLTPGAVAHAKAELPKGFPGAISRPIFAALLEKAKRLTSEMQAAESLSETWRRAQETGLHRLTAAEIETEVKAVRKKAHARPKQRR